jgi:aldehyde dehydrogenase family 7 protein A1
MAEASLTYDQYPFLKELGIEKQNSGCYYGGKWEANGNIINSVSPHNNQVINFLIESIFHMGFL